LSPKAKTSRIALVVALMAAIAADDPVYETLLSAVEKNYPNDSAWDLIRLDPLIMKGRLDEALAAVDRLDRSLGGDPYLDVVRGVCFQKKKDDAKARKYFESAVRREPSMPTGYFHLIDLALDKKEFAEVARLLADLELKAGVPLSDLSEAPLYADFVKSPEYRRLLAGRAKKDASSRCD
jgi:tetratricopeptide (TPR) repeat protein